ncbi:MAG TPA: protein kinase [Gemmata sp.]|nr:protein kinase [Gemmata sp.]
MNSQKTERLRPEAITPRGTGYGRLSASQARRVDETCDGFEKAWRSGESPTIEPLVVMLVGAERLVLVRELILLDVAYRQRIGQWPQANDYVKRFPELDAAWLARIMPGPITFPISPSARQTPQVPGFEIVRELGRGGMGVVYLARQTGLNRLVALKMILPGASATPEERLRLQREAEAIARLQHPNVVQIFQVGETEGRLFLALEYVNGGSLSAHLAGKPLAARAAATLVETLALAIEHAHEHGIIHRDLKPANVLLIKDNLTHERKDAKNAEEINETKQGASDSNSSIAPLPHCVKPSSLTPKITDFGLAKLVQDNAGLTGPNDMLGTPSYMAPEQVFGDAKAIGPAVDIYGLGAILYESLTGRPPFLADSLWATLRQVQHEEPVSPSRLQTQTPHDLATICLKCLEKKPRQRYARAGDLAADLRRFLNREPIHARPPGTVERLVKWARRKPTIATLLAILFVVSVLGFAGILWQWWRAEGEVTTALKAQEKAERQESMAQRAQEEAESQLHFNRLALALHEFEAFRVGQANEILARCPPERRDWEWRYLNRQCHRALFHLTGFTSQIQALAYSPDGQYVAAGCGDWNGTKPGEVLIWDLCGPSGSENQPIRDRNHAGPVYALAFHPDGRRLACAGSGPTIRIWEWAPRRTEESIVQVFRVSARNVSSLDFSPCGKWLSVGCGDGAVRLLDTTTGQVRYTLTGHTDDIFSLKFSPDGRYLASGSRDGTARVWEIACLEQNAEPFRIFISKNDIRSVAFHPKGRFLAVANWSGNIKQFDLSKPDGDPIGWQMRSGSVFDLAFSPDGSGLAWCGSQGPVEICDSRSGLTRVAFRGHDGSVRRVAFSPDGRRLATGGNLDRSVCVWDVTATAEPRTKGWSGSAAIVGMAFSPDGAQIALAGGENRSVRDTAEKSIRLWDLERDNLRKFLPELPTFFTSVAFHPDGRHLAAGGENHITTIWNVATGEIHHTLKGHTGRVTAVAYRNGSDWLATASADGTVILWDSNTGQIVGTLKGHTAGVTSLAFHPNGVFLASASADKTVNVWDLRKRESEPVRTLRGHAAEVSSVAWSPDGRYLASASIDQILKLYDAATGQETMPGDSTVLFGTVSGDVAQGQESRVRYTPRLAFCPRGLRLASVSGNRPAQIWAVPTGQKALALPGTSIPYLCLAFDPTGRRLAASTGAGLVLWDSGSP